MKELFACGDPGGTEIAAAVAGGDGGIRAKGRVASNGSAPLFRATNCLEPDLYLRREHRRGGDLKEIAGSAGKGPACCS